MSKFDFPFDAVLRQRQADEDRCQRDLAKVLRQQMILQTQLRSMQQTIIDSKHNMAGALVGKVDLDSVTRFAHFSGQQSQRAGAIMVEIGRLQQQVSESRRRLTEATRARKSIDLLKQRQLDRWRRRRQRHEAAALDELATQQYVRRSGAEVAR